VVDGLRFMGYGLRVGGLFSCPHLEMGITKHWRCWCTGGANVCQAMEVPCKPHKSYLEIELHIHTSIVVALCKPAMLAFFPQSIPQPCIVSLTFFVPQKKNSYKHFIETS